MLERVPGCAGADEAGRGPLAGPVVCAVVMIPITFEIYGLDDSKKLTEEARLDWESKILATCPHKVEFVWPDEIDRLNILQASLIGMRRAALALTPAPNKVFVDGNRLIPNLGIAQECVVKGDAKFAEIAAASVLAKCARDRCMRIMAQTHPGYGFENHFGYPTPEHLVALQKLGPCAMHRQSFAPVKNTAQGRLF
jgi:ribonuclease HII